METISVRASGLSELFDCPARWKAKHIDKIRSPSSGKAQRGTAIHLGTAIYDEGRIAGNTVSLEEVIEITHDAIFDRDLDVHWNDITQKFAFETSIPSLAKYCLEISPQFEFAAVELHCEAVEVQCDGIVLRLTGTTDRVYTVNGQYGIGDIKTGDRIIDGEGILDPAPHKLQLSVYTLLASLQMYVDMTAPSLIYGIKPGKVEAQAAIAESTASIDYLTGTPDQKGMLEYAAAIIKSGNFYGNNKSFICNKNYCPVFNQCKFR